MHKKCIKVEVLNSIFDKLALEASVIFTSLSVEVKKSFPIECQCWVINCSNLSEPSELSILNEINDWIDIKGVYVYYFKILSDAVSLDELASAFNHAKKNKIGDRSYPRFNGISQYIYVGSSRSMLKRLKEHLGFGSQSTYALNLRYWICSISPQIEFGCAKYPVDTASEVIQGLEDALWVTRKPMLGRRGMK